MISEWLYEGPGSQSFYSAASTLQGVVAQIHGILGGQQANTAVLSTAWEGLTGRFAVSANSPYAGWLGEAAGQIDAAAAQIYATAAAFDFAQGTTWSPGEFQALDWSCYVMMQANFFGLLTPLILMNRMAWGVATSLAIAGYGYYTGASAGMTATLTPLSAPPPATASGSAPLTPIAQVAHGAADSALPHTSALPHAGEALQSVSAAAPLVSQLLSQSSNLMPSALADGSELAQVPASMTSGLAGAPISQAGAVAGPLDSSSVGALPAASGGTVAAALSGGGAGLSGVGGAGLNPIRGPVSWASTANAADNTPGADQTVVSRIAEARAASAIPATSAGMGAPGAMSPAPRQSASERERERNDPLAAAAVLYRPHVNMPVVTGAAGMQLVTGAQFMTGEEDR